VAVLAVLAAGAVAWTLTGKSTGVVNVASAAPAPHAAAATVTTHFAGCPFPHTLRVMFESAARDAQLPPAMLFAVAKVESNLSPNVTSSAGARGLLQVMPATARSLNLDPNEPRTNVLAGARYLRQLIDRFDSTDLALAAYNAGPTAVAQSGGAPTIDVVRYVANVNAVWRAHAGCQ
jgi:soluble lytic murein transglycosylase-like protein